MILLLDTKSPIIRLLETTLIGAVSDLQDEPDHPKDKEWKDNNGEDCDESESLIGSEGVEHVGPFWSVRYTVAESCDVCKPILKDIASACRARA
jgi:hypothetical protein